MAARHGWGGASRKAFQTRRVGSRQRCPSLSKKGSVFPDLCHCV